MRSRPNKKNRLLSYFGHHARVSLATLGRLYAQPIATMMTSAVLAIALALPTGLYIALDNASILSDDWGGSTKISLFLHKHVKDSDAQKFMNRLQAREQIKKVEFVSKEQGLKEFKEISGFRDALKYLNNNPLPTVLIIHPKIINLESDNLTQLVDELSKEKLVELAQLDAQWVKRLYTLLEIAHRSIWVVSIMLALAVLLIIGNTIRLDIQNRREEIEVSKLIGASDAFIRRPFLYTGLWYGVIGGVLATAITLISLLLVEPPINKLALLYTSDFRLTGLGFNKTLLLILVSCSLGLTGSWIAVSRHLKETESP